jgi:hypothetical protein
MFINRCVIIDPVTILCVGFENAASQFVGTHCKYFRVGGKGGSTKEHIHDSWALERKRSFLYHSGRQGARGGNEFEGF